MVLATESARSLCLDWMATALFKKKKQHFQANERLVATDGFILNLVSVLLHLSSKVDQDKLNPSYLQMEFYDNQEKGLNKNFPIECWFLTLQALHIGILPIIRRFNTQVSPRTDTNNISSGTREISEHNQS